MNTLMVIAEMGSGGAETVVAELAGDLVEAGGTVTVATSGGWRTELLEQRGATVFPVDLRGRRHVPDSVRALRRRLRAHPAELIHAHNVKAALVARLASTGRRGGVTPILATLHGLPDGAYPLAARILRRCCDQVVAVSDTVAEQITAAGYPAQRIRVIENAVSQLARHDRDEARRRLGVPADAFVVACIARLAAQKRHDLLVTAWRSMPPGCVLLIAGDGATRPLVERAIDATGQRHRIRLLGDRRDPDWVLAAADLCVLPTDWEGLPISVLEAMSVDVPVLASAVPGLVATVSGAAHLVEPGSAAALARGMARLLADRAHADELAAAGRRLIRTRFAVPRMQAQYRRAYQDVLAHRRDSTMHSRRTQPGLSRLRGES